MQDNAHDARWRLVVLAGGESAEREISLASGIQVAEALDRAGHLIEFVDPAETPLESIAWHDYDACFIALHGGAGEDGRVQAWLEAHGVAYTGSGPTASRLAMSKSASKERFLLAGVPTPPYVLFHATEPHATLQQRLAPLGWPLVIKPDAQGSSLGVHWAHEPAELFAAIASAAAFDSYLLAERAIAGREFTATLLGRTMLPLIEIVTARPFFDLEAKMHDPSTDYRLEIELPDDSLNRLYDAARQAAQCLDASSLVRVDLMLDDMHQPWVLEVNTVPGLTKRSLAPRAAAAHGLDLAALCACLVRECLLRFARPMSPRQRAGGGDGGC